MTGFMWATWVGDAALLVGLVGAAIALTLLYVARWPHLLARLRPILREAQRSQERKQRLSDAYRELETLYARSRELDALKTRAFTNVSKELRTPLTLILAPVERMLSISELGADQRRDLDVVARNARTLLRHVNDLQDVARLDAGEVTPHIVRLDLARLVRESAAPFDPLAQARRIDWTLTAPSVLPAQGDPDMLSRICANLLSNAFKFAPDGGRVDCSVSIQDGTAILQVEDSGPGIPPEYRNAVFERFRQIEDASERRAPGTGLGLAIARELCRLHHGSIRVEDAPGGGARFTVTLPRHLRTDAPPGDDLEGAAGKRSRQMADELLAAAQAPEQPTDAAPGPLVLVAEDNADMTRFLTRILGASCRVAVCGGGGEAVQKALDLRPDVILADLGEPAASGSALVGKFRQHAALDDVPVVILTTDRSEGTGLALLDKGAQDFLVKPFSSDELLARVSNLARMKSAQERLRATLGELKRSYQARTEFMARVSHELRTPLNAIIGFAELLESGPGRSAEDTRMLGYVHAAGEHLLQLINDLLDFARLEAGHLELHPQQVNLDDAVRGAEAIVKPLAERKGVRLAAPEPTGAVLNVDPGRLRQILFNLLSNAIKFTGEGGEVRVEVRRERDAVDVAVSDTGIGIAPANQRRIFEPFVQVAPTDRKAAEGTGLGLTITRQLVEAQGGSIRVESEPGRGSRFTVRLPVAG